MRPSKIFVLILFMTSKSFAQLNSEPCQSPYNIYGLNFSQNFSDQIRSVFKFAPFCDGKAPSCTGTLINQNKDGVPKQYFLTSRHCFDTKYFRILQSHVEVCGSQEVYFMFNFSSPDGSNSSVPTTLIANNGITKEHTSHRYYLTSPVKVIYYTGSNDLFIGEIVNPIPPHFNVYYAGWSPSAIGGTIFNPPYTDIHHPGGDIKKGAQASILTPNEQIQTVTCNVVTRIIDGIFRLFGKRFKTQIICNSFDTYPFYTIPAWGIGSMSKGSSGSPLFNGNKKIIAAMSWSPGANCVNIFTNHSKFRNIYAAEDVDRALNPKGTYSVGYTGIDGRNIDCYQDLTGPNTLSGLYFPANQYQPSNSITISAMNSLHASGYNKWNFDGETELKISQDQRTHQFYEGLTIISGAEFTFNAGQEITLKPGFTVEGGAIFKAQLNGCYVASGRESASVEFPSTKVSQASEQKFISVEARPNPARGQVTIRFTMPDPDKVSILLHDGTGRAIHLPGGEDYHLSGTHEVTFDVSQLQAGFYYFTVKTDRLKTTERVIVTK